jgi:hypothetical protein
MKFLSSFVHNFERYYPEYCSKPRPKITFEHIEYSGDDVVRITFLNDDILPNAVEMRHRIVRVGFMRLSSSTHGFIYDQRYVEMKFGIWDRGIDVPIEVTMGGYFYRNVLPPGPYLVFILFDNGWVSITEPLVLTKSRKNPNAPPRLQTNNQPYFAFFIK